MSKKSVYLFVVAALFILSSVSIGLAGAQGGGEVRAVDFIGAWVDAGAPNGDFDFTAMDGNSYTANFEADVLPMFTTADAWYPGSQACTDCHYANSSDSYHEMDLSSYDGIMTGADSVSNPPGMAVVKPGNWGAERLRIRLRDNRMPPGWEFDLTEENREGPTLTVNKIDVRGVDLIGAWVDDGATNGDFAFTGIDGTEGTGNFDTDIMPLFTTADAWYPGSQACTDCHYANSSDSYHEMDLSSYDGIMTGADALSSPPGVSIIEPGNWGAAKLRNRLRNNRMPPGWEFDLTEENREGPTITAGHAAGAAGGDAAPVTLPDSGGDNSMLAWGLAAAGLLTVMAGMAIRRREQQLS